MRLWVWQLTCWKKVNWKLIVTIEQIVTCNNWHHRNVSSNKSVSQIQIQKAESLQKLTAPKSGERGERSGHGRKQTSKPQEEEGAGSKPKQQALPYTDPKPETSKQPKQSRPERPISQKPRPARPPLQNAKVQKTTCSNAACRMPKCILALTALLQTLVASAASSITFWNPTQSRHTN